MSLKSSLNLTEFGITEEMIDKIVERVQSHISGAYIPKERFDEVNNSLKQQKKMNATLSGQLEGLKDVDVEGLNKKITDLQNENKRQQAEFDKQMSAEKLNNALDRALSRAKARNHKAALALLDRDKIKLTEDGLEGFDEQIKSLKADEKTAFLFESDGNKEPEAPSGFKPDKKPQEPPEQKSAGASAAERYNTQMGVKGN